MSKKTKRIVVRPSLSVYGLQIIYRLLKEEDLKIEKRNKVSKKHDGYFSRLFSTAEEFRTFWLTDYFAGLLKKAKKGVNNGK